jgi:hypothetical protein
LWLGRACGGVLLYDVNRTIDVLIKPDILMC